MSEPRSWMLYGAYGALGRQIIKQAVDRGERPLLAGRSIAKLRSLAEQYHLPWRLLDLREPHVLVAGLADVAWVVNAAGPYAETSHPLLHACLTAGVNYLDLNTEIPVLQQTWSYQSQCRTQGITAVVACGLEVAPVDCLLKGLIASYPDLQSVNVMVEAHWKLDWQRWPVWFSDFALGQQVRDQHQLKRPLMAPRLKSFALSRGAKKAVAYTSAALEVCYHWSRIPNIATYLSYSTNRTRIGICAEDQSGQCVEMNLELLPEPQLSAVIALQALMNLLSDPVEAGLYTPAQALGADFIMQVPGTIRFGFI